MEVLNILSTHGISDSQINGLRIRTSVEGNIALETQTWKGRIPTPPLRTGGGWCLKLLASLTWKALGEASPRLVLLLQMERKGTWNIFLRLEAMIAQ